MALSRSRDEWLADGAACLEAALAYLAAGWCPIPLCPPDHVGVGKGHGRSCKSPGKAPLVSGWSSFGKLPSPDEVRHWWAGWPNANVGIVMGRISGMVGLDVDGPGGEAALAGVIAAVGIPPTQGFLTPGGGRRLLFALDAEETIRIAISFQGKKQELRLLAEGSQTVAPPSRHPSGGYYLWDQAQTATAT
jgi:hypothetical protein